MTNKAPGITNIPFENLLPGKRFSPELKTRVKRWLDERGYSLNDRCDYILFQVGFSYVAVFFYQVSLPGRDIECLCLQSYVMGPFAAGFLVMAEGITQRIFYDTLDLFKLGAGVADMQIAMVLQNPS
jgi:hypothetical protein